LAGLGSWFIKNDVAPYTPRRFPATAWINGSIYIAGGRTALAGMFGGIEMVTPSLISGNASIANAVSSQFPTLPSAVYVMASATRSNQLLMVGGWNNSFADTNRFTSFTPGTNGLGGQLMQ